MFFNLTRTKSYYNVNHLVTLQPWFLINLLPCNHFLDNIKLRIPRITMAQKFGKTWWGEQFLKALTDIDYSNRLPRGRSYANNGSVLTIKTENNRVEARVRGSRSTPYSVDVTVPLFSDVEKKKLMQSITGDPLLLSHLLNRELPDELNDIAKKQGIAVFSYKIPLPLLLLLQPPL